MVHVDARMRSILELTAITGLVALDHWWLAVADLHVLRLLNLLILVLLGILVFRRIDRIPRGFKLSRPGFGRAMCVVLLASAAEAVLLCLSAWMTGTLEQDFTLRALGKSMGELPTWFLGKILVVLGQQIALLYLVFPLCFQITRSRWPAALLGSVLFGLLHAPNPFLAVGSFLAGPVWFWLFLYTERFWAPVLTHLTIVILVRLALPAHVHLNLKIGAKTLPLLKTSCWLYTHDFFPLLARYGSRAYYEDRGGTDRAFISGLYRDILGRKRREKEDANAWWCERLQEKSRTEVVILFLTSREYLQKNGLPPP